jgi:hypothetical protein
MVDDSEKLSSEPVVDEVELLLSTNKRRYYFPVGIMVGSPEVLCLITVNKLELQEHHARAPLAD